VAGGDPEADRGAGAEVAPELGPDAAPDATPDASPDAAPEPSAEAGGREPRPTRPSAPGERPPRPGTSKLPPSPSPAPRPAKPAKTGVACANTSRCTIDKEVFDDMVTSPQRLTREAKVVPAIRNDVHSGYKLSWVKPGGSVAALGFRSGDKITHVNGRDLTDDMQAMALYMSLSGTKVFKVRYERGTQKLVKTITVV